VVSKGTRVGVSTGFALCVGPSSRDRGRRLQTRSDAPEAPQTSRTRGGVLEEGACPLLPWAGVVVSKGSAQVCESLFPRSPGHGLQTRSDAPDPGSPRNRGGGVRISWGGVPEEGA